jgi:hypothetical protein
VSLLTEQLDLIYQPQWARGLISTDPCRTRLPVLLARRVFEMKLARVFWMIVILALSTGLLSACFIVEGRGDDEPIGKVNFIEPLNGARVASPFTVRMGAEGVKAEPANQGVRDGYGHHHIIIDSELPPLDQPVHSDEQHDHFSVEAGRRRPLSIYRQAITR